MQINEDLLPSFANYVQVIDSGLSEQDITNGSQYLYYEKFSNGLLIYYGRVVIKEHTGGTGAYEYGVSLPVLYKDKYSYYVFTTQDEAWSYDKQMVHSTTWSNDGSYVAMFSATPNITSDVFIIGKWK